MKAVEESLKLLLILLSLGFSATVAKDEITQLVINVGADSAAHPILVKASTGRPVAIFPVLFPRA